MELKEEQIGVRGRRNTNRRTAGQKGLKATGLASETVRNKRKNKPGAGVRCHSISFNSPSWSWAKKILFVIRRHFFFHPFPAVPFSVATCASMCPVLDARLKNGLMASVYLRFVYKFKSRLPGKRIVRSRCWEMIYTVMVKQQNFSGKNLICNFWNFILYASYILIAVFHF